MRSIRTSFKVVLAVAVGIILFAIDLLIGADLTPMVSLAVFTVILFVVGVISGGVRNGLVSAMLTLLAMIPVGVWLQPFIPYLPGSSDFVAVALMLMIAMMCSPNWSEIEGDPLGVCCLFLILITFIAVFAPWLYFASFLIGGLGGFLGRGLWRCAGATEAKASEPAGSPTEQSAGPVNP